METYIKQPLESLPITIDFTPWMNIGETISGYIIYVDEVQQSFPELTGVVYSATLSGNTHLILQVQNGIDGTDYKITSEIYTYNSNIYEYDFNLSVKADSNGVRVNDSLTYVVRYNTTDTTLYIVPTEGTSLGYNTQYNITIAPGLSGIISSTLVTEPMQSAYSFWFTSLYCPQFTTITRIRLEIGPYASTIIDDTIHRMILKNSQDAMELLAVATNTRSSWSAYGCSWENVPYILRRYVECKTAYDILALLELINSAGGAGGSQTKILGDMTIIYGGSNAANNKIDPGKKKQLYDCWIEMLNGIKSTGINTAVKGYYDESKGFVHPVRDIGHNRVIRAVSWRNSEPFGPWENSTNWRAFD